MNRKKLTQAIEDYLKIIYDLTSIHERATTTQIAEALDVKPASVTGMMRKLAVTDPPLVEYRKHQGVVLTPAGERVALEIIRHHRLLELFLHDTLGYPWDEVHDEAERLEHVISEEFEERIAQVLGNPQYDPHGDPIPNRDLKMPSYAMVCLDELRPGQRATIKRVRDTDPALLRYLGENGVVLQARFMVIKHSSFDDNLKIQIDGRDEPVVIGPSITSQVFVEADL
ncbi:MAG: metal-dependent transcriptional regulator [Chloroflexi bacterium]|nr:metal-dependent transcriptional regulator [Chloroflexota bacterium]MBU1660592.1 metal-dependent transcriptional regulator [Chloroflexota bacterium]